MESIEIKDAIPGPEEPIKTEEVVATPDTSERSNNAVSPPPNCSICLGKLINTSFTDSCLHQFCFTCLLQWSKIKTECPLCKQTFKSIIHNVRSEEDYDQYHVQYTSQQVAATLDVTADIHISGQWGAGVGVEVPVRNFMYRTTMGSNRRYGMMLNPEAVARRVQIPSITPQIPEDERRQRNENPIDYRRRVYRHGVWAALLPDAFGRFRESFPEYYRQHPTEVTRLIPWLSRELTVLLNANRPHICYVLSIILDAVTQYYILSDEFKNIIRPFFGIHTNHFVHEFSNFARTNFDLVGYDQAVTYVSNRGLSNTFVRSISPTPSSSSSSSSDSDVRVLDDSFDRLAPVLPPYDFHANDVPGPNTRRRALRLHNVNAVPDVLTISSSSSSSSENECEVIGYVKPRHERTPEIIDLSSSSSSEVDEVVSTSQPTNSTQAQNAAPYKQECLCLPSTSSGDTSSYRRTRRQTDEIFKAQYLEYLEDSSSESDSDESDSDYSPLTKSKRHKNAPKKGSKTTSRKLCTRKRTRSVGMQRKRDKEARNRSPSSSSSSDIGSLEREASKSRGTKRYLSKSSDNSDFERPTKKNKKSKKAKTSRKGKKRRITSKAPTHNYSNSFSSGQSSDSEDDSNIKDKRKNKRRSKRYYRYPSEENSVNDKSSLKSNSTKGTSQRTDQSDLSDCRLRSPSLRRSSSVSLNNSQINDLKNDYYVPSRYNTSEDNEEVPSSSRILEPSSQSSDRLSTTPTSSSTSKSDVSSLTEHSVSSKVSSDRRRSHKKRKESKKHRRSRS